MSLSKVRQIILILSGKGGVGKSSITTQLALSLTLAGHNVGILDIDLTGPSIPRFLGIEDEKIKQIPGGWQPVLVHEGQDLPLPTTAGSEGDGQQRIGSLHTLSLAFLLSSRSSAIVWRGPKKTAMIRQFLTDVLWPELDYLLIDTPPGTSDEHISVVETLLKTVSAPTLHPSGSGPALAGAVLVTTPQAISISDVRKEINFCAKTRVPVIGVVENMSGYVCPCCGVVTNLFSKGGGEVMAREFGVGFLGGVPVDPLWGRLVEEGVRPVYRSGEGVEEGDVEDDGEEDEDEMGGEVRGRIHDGELLVDKYRDCSLYPLFREITRKVVDTVRDGSAVFVDPNAVRQDSSA